MSNKYFSPTHDMPKTAQITKLQKSNVVSYLPMKTKTQIATEAVGFAPKTFTGTEWKVEAARLRKIAEQRKIKKSKS